jgi:hypothetical protein
MVTDPRGSHNPAGIARKPVAYVVGDRLVIRAAFSDTSCGMSNVPNRSGLEHDAVDFRRFSGPGQF